MLTVLMLAKQNTSPAGYVLIGKISMFLGTDGSVAWLYHCPIFLSPPRVPDKWYDRILILFERTTKIVDPITRPLMTSRLRYPVWVITLICFHLISRIIIPGIRFYLIPFLLKNFCCSSQLNLEILLSFLLLTLGLLECILPSKRNFSGILSSVLQLLTLS